VLPVRKFKLSHYPIFDWLPCRTKVSFFLKVSCLARSMMSVQSFEVRYSNRFFAACNRDNSCSFGGPVRVGMFLTSAQATGYQR
jgi:hypothetical protein